MEVQVAVRAPTESVWTALVDPEALARWCCDTVEVELRPGGAYRLGGRHHPGHLLSGGLADGRLLAVEEPSYLLEPDGAEGTLLRVRHETACAPTELALSDTWVVQWGALKAYLGGSGDVIRIDYGVPVRGGARCSIAIAAPPERIFAVLTDPGLVARWLSGNPGTIELVPGGNFDSGWRDREGRQTGPGRVLRVEPGRHLAYAWHYEGDPAPSEAAWTITPEDARSLLTLEHGPFPGNWDAIGYAVGWTCCLLDIRELAEAGTKSIRIRAA